MRIASVVFCVVTLCASAAGAQTVDSAESPAMVTWINATRAERGLPPVARDPRLDALAEGHSVDMARHNFFSHESPTTGTVEDRAALASFRWRSLGENIAFNQSPRAAYEALTHSPGHYANITGNYTAVGIGLVRTHDGVYVTQVFATPVDIAPTQPAQPVTTQTVPVVPVAPVAPTVPVAPLPQAVPVVPAPAQPPRQAPQMPWGNDPWTALGLPQWFPGLNAPWPQNPAAPNAPNTGTARMRHCEIDTPFGHVSVSVAGDGVNVQGLPCNPDGNGASTAPATPAAPPQARPQRTSPGRRNAPTAPAPRVVPRVDVPAVPMLPQSDEPLGATPTI